MADLVVVAGVAPMAVEVVAEVVLVVLARCLTLDPMTTVCILFWTTSPH